jgi:uncharacterized repeat protein (TIGR02543 family)
MATIRIESLQTINKDVSGYWQSRTCPPTSLSYSGVITAGEPCSIASGGIYNDDNNNCFECVGYSRTEVRTLKQGTTTVYVKCYVSFDENGGTTVGNRYVYFGNGSGSNGDRTYGQYASLPTPTRSGYTFNGWFDDEDNNNNGTGNQITNTTVVPVDIGLNQTLYAKWTQNQQQTATPTIFSAQQGSFPFLTQGFRVRNNDGSTATIYAEANDSTPDVNRGSVASGSQTSFISLGCQSGNCNDTVYAKAQASGETMSATTSLYIQ